MTGRLFHVALGGALLALGGCVVAPPPMAMMQQNCQQFTQPIIINGNAQPGYGVQCLQPDGTWQIAVPAGPTPPAAAAVPYPAYVPYAYDPYYYGYPYPWYFGPDVGIGIGVGRDWGGGWGSRGWRR